MTEEHVKLNDEKDNVVYVKAKEQIYTFEKSTYREDLLQDLLPKSRYDEIIEEAGRTMGQSWATKRSNDQIKIPNTVIVLSVAAVLLTIVYMVTLYTSTTAEEGTALFVVSIICISSASFIVFGLSIYNFCRKIGKFKSLDMIIKEDLDAYFLKLNNEFSGKVNFSYNEVKKHIEITALNVTKKKIVNNENNNNDFNEMEMRRLQS
jgi:hypothetical protein